MVNIKDLKSPEDGKDFNQVPLPPVGFTPLDEEALPPERPVMQRQQAQPYAVPAPPPQKTMRQKTGLWLAGVVAAMGAPIDAIVHAFSPFETASNPQEQVSHAARSPSSANAKRDENDKNPASVAGNETFSSVKHQAAIPSEKARMLKELDTEFAKINKQLAEEAKQEKEKAKLQEREETRQRQKEEAEFQKQFASHPAGGSQWGGLPSDPPLPAIKSEPDFDVSKKFEIHKEPVKKTTSLPAEKSHTPQATPKPLHASPSKIIPKETETVNIPAKEYTTPAPARRSDTPVKSINTDGTVNLGLNKDQQLLIEKLRASKPDNATPDIQPSFSERVKKHFPWEGNIK